MIVVVLEREGGLACRIAFILQEPNRGRFVYPKFRSLGIVLVLVVVLVLGALAVLFGYRVQRSAPA